MKKMTIKTILTLAALALLLTFTVSGTLAYISTSTGNVVNEFTPAEVTCAVSETFANNRKTNVGVKNTGNTTAWIRATVVGNWVKDNMIVAPWSDNITYASGWTKGNDGFWYCNTKTDADETTANLFDSYPAPETAPVAGAHLELTIVCQAVQENLGESAQAAFAAAKNQPN